MCNNLNNILNLNHHHHTNNNNSSITSNNTHTHNPQQHGCKCDSNCNGLVHWSSVVLIDDDEENVSVMWEKGGNAVVFNTDPAVDSARCLAESLFEKLLPTPPRMDLLQTPERPAPSAPSVRRAPKKGGR
eukprot:c1577_g1_i1.p3 GENE.c1577_g1_i1~~c1577_g1_i1.p3  ORF type:complete len:140 (+),score=51.09 c1577_g1_i1:32-421(+)